MLEIDFIAEHEAPARIELIFVVITEPMKLRPARDRTDGWKFLLVLRAQDGPKRSSGNSAEKGAAGENHALVGNSFARQTPVRFSNDNRSHPSAAAMPDHECAAALPTVEA